MYFIHSHYTHSEHFKSKKYPANYHTIKLAMNENGLRHIVQKNRATNIITTEVNLNGMESNIKYSIPFNTLKWVH